MRYVMPGDFATVEVDGTITLLGRGSVSINSGGEKIFPEEVESAVRSHPEVFDAIVVGAPDERWGQRVAAIVAPRSGRNPTLPEIQEHCRTSIAGYKVPRQLHVVEAIVRSPSGKPDYRWAAEVVAEVPAESDAGGARALRPEPQRSDAGRARRAGDALHLRGPHHGDPARGDR